MNQKKAEVTPLMQVAIKPLMAHTASFRAPMNQKEGRGKTLVSSENTTSDGSHSLLMNQQEGRGKTLLSSENTTSDGSHSLLLLPQCPHLEVRNAKKKISNEMPANNDSPIIQAL